MARLVWPSSLVVTALDFSARRYLDNSRRHRSLGELLRDLCVCASSDDAVREIGVKVGVWERLGSKPLRKSNWAGETSKQKEKKKKKKQSQE